MRTISLIKKTSKNKRECESRMAWVSWHSTDVLRVLMREQQSCLHGEEHFLRNIEHILCILPPKYKSTGGLDELLCLVAVKLIIRDFRSQKGRGVLYPRTWTTHKSCSCVSFMVWGFIRLHEAAIPLHLQSFPAFWCLPHGILGADSQVFAFFSGCCWSYLTCQALAAVWLTQGRGSSSEFGAGCRPYTIRAVFGFHDVLQFDLAQSRGWSREPDSDLRSNVDFVFQLSNSIIVWQSGGLTCSGHVGSTCDLLGRRLLVLWAAPSRKARLQEPALAGPGCCMWAGSSETLGHAQRKAVLWREAIRSRVQLCAFPWCHDSLNIFISSSSTTWEQTVEIKTISPSTKACFWKKTPHCLQPALLYIIFGRTY